jgi:hypothetical protein
MTDDERVRLSPKVKRVEQFGTGIVGNAMLSRLRTMEVAIDRLT